MDRIHLFYNFCTIHPFADSSFFTKQIHPFARDQFRKISLQIEFFLNLNLFSYCEIYYELLINENKAFCCKHILHVHIIIVRVIVATEWLITSTECPWFVESKLEFNFWKNFFIEEYSGRSNKVCLYCPKSTTLSRDYFHLVTNKITRNDKMTLRYFCVTHRWIWFEIKRIWVQNP